MDYPTQSDNIPSFYIHRCCTKRFSRICGNRISDSTMLRFAQEACLISGRCARTFIPEFLHALPTDIAIELCTNSRLASGLSSRIIQCARDYQDIIPLIRSHDTTGYDYRGCTPIITCLYLSFLCELE